MPVPEAPTIPIAPRRTTLAKPRPTPFRIAVPQSGPIINRQRLGLFERGSRRRLVLGADRDYEVVRPRGGGFTGEQRGVTQYGEVEFRAHHQGRVLDVRKREHLSGDLQQRERVYILPADGRDDSGHV